MLELVGLEGKANRLPHELSGGEQQRVAIARAFVNRPLMLLADEPTGNLDPDTSQDIMLLLERINRTGTTVLMATHDHHDRRLDAPPRGRARPRPGRPRRRPRRLRRRPLGSRPAPDPTRTTSPDARQLRVQRGPDRPPAQRDHDRRDDPHDGDLARPAGRWPADRPDDRQDPGGSTTTSSRSRLPHRTTSARTTRTARPTRCKALRTDLESNPAVDDACEYENRDEAYERFKEIFEAQPELVEARAAGGAAGVVPRQAGRPGALGRDRRRVLRHADRRRLDRRPERVPGPVLRRAQRRPERRRSRSR